MAGSNAFLRLRLQNMEERIVRYMIYDTIYRGNISSSGAPCSGRSRAYVSSPNHWPTPP